MGKWVRIKQKQTHKCEHYMPNLDTMSEYGTGSIWECDCGTAYELRRNVFVGPYFKKLK